MAEEQQSSSTAPPPPFTIPFPRFNKLSREMNYKFRENECIRIAFIHLPTVATSFWHQSRMPERLIRKLTGGKRRGAEEWKRKRGSSGMVYKVYKAEGRHPVKGIYEAARDARAILIKYIGQLNSLDIRGAA